MARLIHPERQDEPSGGLGCRRWMVRGVASDNAATRFWSGLIDEVLADYQFPTTISLFVATSGTLAPIDLHPDRALERDMAGLAGKDLQQAFRETLAVLEITGPPPPTTVRLSRPGQPHPFLTAILDLPDAEIMSFLLAWLLEWQQVPACRWNDPVVEGTFSAADILRQRRYEIRCRLSTRHLSEGLFERETTLLGTCRTEPFE